MTDGELPALLELLRDQQAVALRVVPDQQADGDLHHLLVVQVNRRNVPVDRDDAEPFTVMPA